MKKVPLCLVAVATLTVAAAACSKKSGASFAAVDFPAGFWWGTANSAFQVEGGIYNDDWWAWTTLPGKIANGDTAGTATNFYNLYDTDFALAQADGHNAFRFSIEWSRIEPQIGVWDTAEIAHYHSVISAARARGLRPVVTLEHYTLPLWADDPRQPANPQVGWISTAVQAEFVTFSGKMAAEYGADVDDWITFNEPLAAAEAGLDGVFPPSLTSIDETAAYVLGMIQAHAKAYDAIKANDTIDASGGGYAAHIGVAEAVVDFYPAVEDSTDVAANIRIDHISNRLFLDAIVKGELDSSLNAVEVYQPDLANKLDFVGLNYYRKMLVQGGLPPPLLGLPENDPTTPHNDLGWSIYPRGIYETLLEVGSYGLPVLITENGIADHADAQRSGYLVDHLVYVKKAMDQGVPVIGYLHWSLTDNFEWAEGFTADFGLYQMDYATLARIPRPSAAVYAQIAKANGLSPGVQQAHRGIPDPPP